MKGWISLQDSIQNQAFLILIQPITQQLCCLEAEAGLDSLLLNKVI